MKNKILSAFTIILAVLYPLSFLLEKKSNQIKTYETAFLNPKNINSVQKIKISDTECDLYLLNKNGIWSGNVSSSDKEMIFSAEQQTVKNFIKNLSSIKKLYLSSSNSKILNDSNWNFKISYTLQNGIETEILIGKTDISKSKRFIKLPSEKKIYKTDANFEPFLTTDANFWVCPNLFTAPDGNEITEEKIQRITFVHQGKKTVLIPGTENFSEKAEKLLSLRHGKLSDDVFSRIMSDTIEIETEDNKFTRIKIQPKDEDFLVQYEIDGKFYTAEISLWTYNKIIEIFSRP